MKNLLMAMLWAVNLSPAMAQMNVNEQALSEQFQREILPGKYRAEGWNPGVDRAGPPSYMATLELRAVDNAVLAKWTMGQQSYTGTAMTVVVAQPGQDPVYIVSVGYKDSPQSTGVITYRLMSPVQGGPLRLEGSWPTPGGWGFERSTSE